MTGDALFGPDGTQPPASAARGAERLARAPADEPADRDEWSDDFPTPPAWPSVLLDPDPSVVVPDPVDSQESGGPVLAAPLPPTFVPPPPVPAQFPAPPPAPEAIPPPRFGPSLPPRPDARPPIRADEEPSLFGLTRRSRSRLGSRLFAAVFVAIFLIILLQVVTALVSGI